MPGKESLNLFDRFGARYRIALLYEAAEFLFVTFDLQQLIFGQFAPGDPGGADALLPSTFEIGCTGQRSGASGAPGDRFRFRLGIGCVHGELP